MPFLTLFLIALASTVAKFFLSLFSLAFRTIPQKNVQKQLKTLGSRFFYQWIYRRFVGVYEQEGIVFSSMWAKQLVSFVYATVTTLIAFSWHPLDNTQDLWIDLGVLLLAFTLFFLVGDHLPRLIAIQAPTDKVLKRSAFITSLLMSLLFPFLYPIFLVMGRLRQNHFFQHLREPTAQVRKELAEIAQEVGLEELDDQDRKFIASILRFRKHLAREIMVPRVEVFGLSADTSIREAATALQPEGYSRVPIYRGNMDNIVGILMYKDVLHKFMEYEQSHEDKKILDAPVESIMKAPLYIPETKKIANLLQEFRKKQIHIAIVVDEYGGTEGLVTIEDILEQIVGEIADEYDSDEGFFCTQTEGGWIIDARMSILDVEEQLGIKIPQGGEYDTIGGYLFHCAGTIPSRGFVVHHDEFEISVLRSNERYVERVRIKPLSKSESPEG